MKNERFVTLIDTREALLGAARTLRKQAAAEAPSKGEARAKSLDFGRVRETIEDLAESGLAKKADVEQAIEKIQEDPTLLCDVVRNIGTIALEARKASAEAVAAESPGTLVGKKATAERKQRSSMSDLFAIESRRIDEKVASHRR